MVSDRDRHELYVALQERLGPEPADTMMDLLPPVGWADVARKADIEALRIELGAKLDASMASLLLRTVYADIMLVVAVAGIVLAAAKLT